MIGYSGFDTFGEDVSAACYVLQNAVLRCARDARATVERRPATHAISTSWTAGELVHQIFLLRMHCVRHFE